MLRVMKANGAVRVVADQVGTPTAARFLAETLWKLVAKPEITGIHHWTDAGVASWYDFAVAIQDEALARGLLPRAKPILPIYSSEYPTKAQRPAFSVLDSAATRSLLKLPATHWRHNLRMMLDELRAS